MKKVLIIANHAYYILNFRKELIVELISENFEVHIVSPAGDGVSELKKLGCVFIEADINRHGKNPFQDILLLLRYKQIMRQVSPNVVLTYTIKPNIYGGLASKILGIPCLANITGLGTAVENPGLLAKLIIVLYKISFSNKNTVFFQNKTNMNFFIEKKIHSGNHILLPGSGVNLERFKYEKIALKKDIDFIFVGRLMRDKGIYEYIEAAKIVKEKYTSCRFHIVGMEEEKDVLENIIENKNYINYHGYTQNMNKLLAECECIVLPSYHEGMSNTLLEAAAKGRILIASDIPGCQEIIDHEKNGFLFKKKDVDELVLCMEKVVNLTDTEKINMSKQSRSKVEKNFDRKIIVDKYMSEIEKLEEIK